LHAAGGEALIKFLVENGAKMDAENRLKQTPLDVAKRTKGEKSAAAQLLAKLSAK
jgi:ankyrin repeat protein